jgi:hypothetical protein
VLAAIYIADTEGECLASHSKPHRIGMTKGKWPRGLAERRTEHRARRQARAAHRQAEGLSHPAIDAQVALVDARIAANRAKARRRKVRRPGKRTAAA